MIISLDAKKAFGKIQQFFEIKTINKLATEGNCLNLIKGIHENATDIIMVKDDQK